MLEYQQLKEEQRLRIGIRDHLIYATLGVLAMAVGGVVQLDSPKLLLLTPPACMALGWTYLVNDDRITALGRHVQTVIGPQLAQLLDAGIPVFGWEAAHRNDHWQRTRKRCQLAVDLLIFCTPALAALVVAWSFTTPSPILAAIVLVEAVGIGFLTFRLATNARTALSRMPSTKEPRT
jgi:hypothetical protein